MIELQTKENLVICPKCKSKRKASVCKKSDGKIKQILNCKKCRKTEEIEVTI